ncbi:hypothetical protein ECG_01771 [Echinococcus granulosus]|nr:hypothetical protein ECG_01771 [Echinococcus granulosus]
MVPCVHASNCRRVLSCKTLRKVCIIHLPDDRWMRKMVNVGKYIGSTGTSLEVHTQPGKRCVRMIMRLLRVADWLTAAPMRGLDLVRVLDLSL